ncbi:hypothetical protein ENSA5_19460 [Enhygromyxa salina]|uniref:Adhesin domain-containing protein n=1 Tax=Enhygromyxa salina TaxID=215803 RepID=A0A2S9YD14_9BACT|nr:purine-nucleoside phosphorylase [Enhygromyxa salina]PRQ03007.1 hypothetical protein ENSA5_19460 [Enhygromyxa salina]
MIKRLLPPALLVASSTAFLIASPGCGGAPEDPTEIREPYLDSWEEVAQLPAAQFGKLSIGDRLTSDNFANRGDVEVRYVSGTDVITVEMQRFTVASDQAAADEAFGRMQYWGYDIATPEPPSDANMVDSCENPDGDAVDACYIRAYYDGLFQPLRDGANFRVTIPAGWGGDLDIVTSDNLEEGIDSYPDRSDVIVDGVAGNLTIDLDSGNAQVKMDANTQHYAGCSANDTCVMEGYAMGCGCTTPTNIAIENSSGQSSNITVDVNNADNWYTMVLENQGTFSASDDFVCNATIDCSSFADCVIDDAYEALAYQERAEINYPGDPAIEGAGMRVALVSKSCANIKYVDGPEDYEAESLPEEKRGELRVCVGCLEDL